MNDFPKPSITIQVDVTNPGQFFACCGLLELADRLWPGAESWFEPDQFCITKTGTLREVLDSLADCQLTNTMSSAQLERFKEIKAMDGKERKKNSGTEDELKSLEELNRVSIIILGPPLNISLDWFVDDLAGGSRFKTWAGRQSVLEIAMAMKTALQGTEWRTRDCLDFSAIGCGLPFNFDSDLGGQGGALDIGFSFDPLASSAISRIKTMAKPALEMLAFIGLLRFRPAESQDKSGYFYSPWKHPLPIESAMPAACGIFSNPGANLYKFRLLYRTKYLKSFLPAFPFSGDSYE